MHDWKDDRIFERACVGLSNLGHEVHLIASPQMKHYLSEEGQKDGSPTSVVNNVTLHWLKKRNGWKRRIISSLEAAHYARSLQADIIHFHDPDLLPFMLWIKWRGATVVYDVHENYASRFFRPRIPKFIASLLSVGYRKIENWLIRQFDGAIFVTESLKNLCSSCEEKALVVGNLPYLKLLKQSTLPEKKYPRITIVTSGTISDERNATQTVEAAQELKKRGVEAVDFLFAGKYTSECKKAMLRIIEKEKLNNVRLEGMLPYLKNFQRVGMAHIGCVFYEDNINNRIGLPNRAFEYMYSGLMILGDDFPEVRRLIEETQCGIVTNSKNPKELADKIESLLDNPELIQELGNNGRRAVMKNYNFEQALNDLVLFYKRII